MPSLSRPLASLSDTWISRRAAPQPEALAAVSRFSPAVVVTGASRGIGRALAQRFAHAGRDVALIAREAGALDAVAKEIAQSTGVRAVAVPLDITLTDAPPRLDAALKDAGLYVDVLVNNAGVGLAGAFADQSRDELDALIALNVTAATRLMQHALPSMLARGRGGVLNIGSLGGLVPGPYQAAYYASKAYLVSLTEAAAFEARGRGVRIAVVAPGPVDTTFHRTMRAENALYRTVIPALSAEAVANSAYRGFMIGRTVIVPGVLPTLAAVAVKILPHAVTVPLVGALLGVGERTPPNDRAGGRV
jgi:short-subunit dehydrogenase